MENNKTVMETSQGSQAARNQQSLLENAESLADLPLTDARAEAAKGGGGSTATAGQFPYQVSLRAA